MNDSQESAQQAFERMLKEDSRKERRLFWGEWVVLAVLLVFIVLRSMYLGG